MKGLQECDPLKLPRLSLVVSCALVFLPRIAMSQEAPTDLRETVDDSAVDQIVAPAPPPPPAVFDDTQTPRRKKRNRAIDDVNGLQVGALRLYPMLEIGVVASDNGGLVAKNRKTDAALRIAPSLRLQSDWSRHELDAAAKINYQKSLATGDLTAVSSNNAAHFRLDIRRSTQADFDVSYDVSQATGANGDLATDAAKPRRDHSAATRVSLRHDFGAWFAEAGLGASGLYAEDTTLSDGTTENNADRAYVQPAARLRAGLSNGALWRPFAEVSYDPRFYVKNKDRNGVRRDSHGYNTMLGLEFDDAGIWSGSIAAAYTLRDYAAAGLNSEQAVGLEAHASWKPQESTSVDFNSTVGVQDDFSTGSTAVRVWTVDLALSHALTDRLKLNGGAGLTIEDGSSGTDETYSTRLGAEWQLNPFFALSGEVGSTWFDAAKKADRYDEQHASVSAVIRK
jgi:hypothetical protein